LLSRPARRRRGFSTTGCTRSVRTPPRGDAVAGGWVAPRAARRRRGSTTTGCSRAPRGDGGAFRRRVAPGPCELLPAATQSPGGGVAEPREATEGLHDDGLLSRPARRRRGSPRLRTFPSKRTMTERETSAEMFGRRGDATIDPQLSPSRPPCRTARSGLDQDGYRFRCIAARHLRIDETQKQPGSSAPC